MKLIKNDIKNGIRMLLKVYSVFFDSKSAWILPEIQVISESSVD